MRFWKKRLQRVVAMVCSVALVASMMPTAVFATEPEPTPTPEPTSIVETTPTPEPSESPVSTDAAGTTSAPGTDADSTAAPSEEPTVSPDGSPAPSEEPVESPEPSEEPAEEVQLFNAPVQLDLEPAAAPKGIGDETATSDDEIFSVDYYNGPGGKSDLTIIALDEEGQTLDTLYLGKVYASSSTMSITLNDAYKTVYELDDVKGDDGVYILDWSGDFNDAQSTTFTWADTLDWGNYGKGTIYLHLKTASHVLELKNSEKGVDLGTITWKEGGKQLTTVKVYLNYDLVYTSEPLAISNALNNFVLDLKDGYYFNTVTMEDIQYTSSIGGQTFTYNSVGDYNRLVFGAIPSIFDGTNTVSLYVFNYEDGVQVKYDRYVNNGITNVNAACPSLDIAYTVNGYNTQFTYTDLDSYIYLPKNTKVTTTANVQDGYYFEYWHTADAAVGKNNLYTIGADGNPILQYTGPLEGQIGHVAFSQSMMAEYGSAFTSGIIGLYMTDGDRPVIDYYDYRITYCPNGENVTPADNQVQYFYRSSNGTYGTVIRGCMFTRDGYEFLGWNTKPDGTGTAYTPDAVYGSENGENDLTLYAQWEKIETPQPGIPDVDVTELGAIIAVDCTTAAEDHPTWMSTILGTLEKDYIIEYSSNRTTATIKIANTDLYLDEYCQLKGYHALDETNASDLSFKLKYENDAWVLDSDDNTAATIYVACPDVTVEKKITSVERDGQPLNPVPEMLKVGDEINYQIVITNNSNITLNDLTVTDTFTGANKPGSVSDSEETWEETAGSWTWSDTLTLAVNGKKTFTYTYTVAEGDKGNTIRNSAAVAGQGLDDDEETDDETTPEVENPAVGVEKSLVQVKRGEEIFLAEKGTIPEELEVGDELTYEIEVKNIGNVKLNGLTLTDTFNGHFAPSKVKDKVANVELTNEWEKDTTTGLWTLKIENISPDVGEIETYTYTYIVNQADAGKPLTNTAAVTGDGTDPDDDTDEHEVKDDGTVTIHPADITIYKGGDSGSTSVVEDNNGTIAENNSLPTPGFYFDLPDAVNKAVSAYYGVPSAEAVDLSRFITITAKAEDGSDRVWNLEKYGEGETSFTTIGGQEHYIYKLVAGDGQDPVRVQFTDDQGNFVTSDDFTLEDAMCETYTMQIYTGSVDTSTLTIKVEIPEKDDVPAQTFHCGYGATKTATLTVRYVNSEQEEVVTDAVTAITDVAQENTPLENAYVVADSDAVFNVNDSSVSVNQNSVSLLFDDLTTGETETNKAVERLLAIAEDKSGLTGTIEQQAKYLNLVDADNGNAWLTAEEDVTIYWPYPEGTDKNTKFSLLHFDGIDREMAIGNLVSEVEGVTPEPMMITKDDYGISFTTKTFSPFVLMWETEQPSGGEDKPSGGGDGNNDNNNNNTNTNNQTTTVNVANQAAAPAAAPAAVSVPQTSDDMPIGALTAAAVAAAAALVGLLVVRKRRQK